MVITTLATLEIVKFDPVTNPANDMIVTTGTYGAELPSLPFLQF